MAEFNVNLNPSQTNKLDLGDMLKTSAYLKQRPQQVAKNKGTWSDNPMQSGKDIPFTFGGGAQAPSNLKIEDLAD